MKEILVNAKEKVREIDKTGEFLIHMKDYYTIEIKRWNETCGMKLIQSNKCIYRIEHEETYPSMLKDILLQAVLEEKDHVFIAKKYDGNVMLKPYGEKAKKLHGILTEIDQAYYALLEDPTRINHPPQFSFKMPFLHSIPLRFDFEHMCVSFDMRGPYFVCQTRDGVQRFFNDREKENNEMVQFVDELEKHIVTLDEEGGIERKTNALRCKISAHFNLEGGKYYGKDYYIFTCAGQHIRSEADFPKFKRNVFDFFERFDDIIKKN